AGADAASVVRGAIPARQRDPRMFEQLEVHADLRRAEDLHARMPDVNALVIAGRNRDEFGLGVSIVVEDDDVVRRRAHEFSKGLVSPCLTGSASAVSAGAALGLGFGGTGSSSSSGSSSDHHSPRLSASFCSSTAISSA